MNEYLFDFTCYVSTRIRAVDEQSARNILLGKIQDCTVTFGEPEDGDVIVGEATTTAGSIELGKE